MFGANGEKETMMSMKLVLLRHGESEWNLANRFTGWTDVDLSPRGSSEAKRAGEILRDGGYTFDVAYTCLLYTSDAADE